MKETEKSAQISKNEFNAMFEGFVISQSEKGGHWKAI